MKREISASPKGRAGIDRPIRVLHCPADVGGNPQNLARMERELGVDSISVVRRPSKFQYESDRSLLKVGDGYFLGEIKTWKFILFQSQTFDIVHYNFGQSLMTYVPKRTRLCPPRK